MTTESAHPERLCVFVPCTNERDSVRPAVEEVLRHADRIALPVEVMMIDNGSSDGTRGVMETLCQEDVRCTMVVHEETRGLGHCITDAHNTLDEDTWVTVFPSGSEFVFGESIDSLLAVRKGNDVVLGYLYNSVVRRLDRRIVSTAFKKLAKTIYGLRWHSLNGMKLYRARAFQGIDVVAGGHAYVAELLAKAQLRRPELRVAEAPFISRGKLPGNQRDIGMGSILRALGETYRGAQDVSHYRDEMLSRYRDDDDRGAAAESFFPPPTRD
ncbi:MAG: glycosyltransferase [Polyangiales bacterium]